MNQDNKDKERKDRGAQPQSGQVQGEGDYEAARRYNQETTEHAQSGEVSQAARDAKPSDRSEAREMEQAEQQGRERAKGEDPLLDEPERISRDGIVDDKSGKGKGGPR